MQQPLHTLFILRHKDRYLEHSTIDGHYVFQNFYDRDRREDLYLSTDSDEVLFMGLTLEAELTYLPFIDRPINKTVGGLPNRLYNMNKYLYSPECDEFRREAFRMPVRIHSDELTPHSNSIAEYSVARIDLKKHSTEAGSSS